MVGILTELTNSFSPALFAEHFRHDEDEDGSTYAASEKQIQQRVPGRGKQRLNDQCNHSWLQLDARQSAMAHKGQFFQSLIGWRRCDLQRRHLILFAPCTV
jgi:hypothetical protein